MFQINKILRQSAIKSIMKLYHSVSRVNAFIFIGKTQIVWSL